MRSIASGIMLVFLAVLCASAGTFAADAVIRGVVTDSTGKPVRGAIVKAQAGDKIIGRYSQKDGKYELTVPSGSYDLAVDAFGYGIKRAIKDTAQAGEVNFTLTPKVDVTRLSGSDIEQLIPQDNHTRYLERTCIICHDFSWVMHHRGFTADEWAAFLPTMTQGRRPNPKFDQEELAALSTTLEKYFGPNAKYFGPDSDPPALSQIKHPPLADEALTATIREYKIPTGFDAMPHSIFVDPYNNNDVYFGELGTMANKLGYFDARAEQFKEFKTTSGPHTMAASKDGTIWATGAGGQGVGVTSYDPKTGQINYVPSPDAQGGGGGHTVRMDKTGNLWFSSLGTNIVRRYNTNTKEWKDYKFPTPFMSKDAVKTEVTEDGSGNPGTYDVDLDSKGNVWVDVYSYGVIVKLDPETGATQEYTAPKVPGQVVQVRGIKVDSHDNVWFAVFQGHKLGKFDPKTQKFTMYQMPSPDSAPYGIDEDVKTGYIWFGDVSSGNVTRFDPKTEKFVEYQTPTHAISRFVSVDENSRVWFTDYFGGRIGVIDTGEGAKK